MIRKYHNHKLQTTPWHREEELLNRHKTPGRQIKQSNQLSLPHQVFCMLGYMVSTWQFANKKTSNHIRNAVKYCVKTVYFNAKIHNDRE